ncbi:hypothetical protein V6C03_03640 [Methyloligella sp. 2.7D]|uniref:hypothetical protein n=1 Tax=unclassified Methyloligella TaxID=2625955 RepID=UPI00157DCE75|nr:hypothetical protein [Methyloligella sp. GL2]QKP76294.1 hypothetical protein HT051_01785 [Methyloligella sp. GL2]
MAGVFTGLAGVLLAHSAVAQDISMPGVATAEIGQAEISIGGGVGRLNLPDVKYGTKVNGAGNTVHRFSNSNDYRSEFGGAIIGDVLVPWNETSAIAFSGFWVGVDQDDTSRCQATGASSCQVSRIGGGGANPAFTGNTLTERASRDVDHWGTQLEGRYYVTGVPGNAFFNASYVALGGDIRAINQDTSIKFTPGTGGQFARYGESLDTTYYGGYVALGGDYAWPIISNMTGGLGFESSFKGYVGVYSADADYNGRLSGAAASKLGLSTTETSVIAGLTLETRKEFTPRTSLSLVTTHEYYSWVPDMEYFDPSGGRGKTVIGDGDAYSNRTTLRLNIGLGPDALYYK